MPFKDYDQEQQFLLPPFLHDFLPEGHLAKVINEVVNELDLSELYSRYSDLGCSAYHPQMMIKVLFYAYAPGERSSRVIAHKLKSDLAYMYLSALQCPDFRTICRFRQENVALLKDFFLQIVRLCREMGMLPLGTIALDSTKLKANASSRRTKRASNLEEEIAAIEKEMESLLEECQEQDKREDELLGKAESPYEVNPELRDREKLKEKLREGKSQEVNLTDEEATTMLHKGYQSQPSYNGRLPWRNTGSSWPLP
ncbi:MAG: transposase [bacterium]